MIHNFYDPLQRRSKIEMRPETYLLDHFPAKELGCDCCGMIRMARGFAEHLVVLRYTVGTPMVLNSACRCEKHNQEIGGHPSSSHLCDHPTKHTETVDYGCCGVDVRNPSNKLISTAIALGWSVGISNGFSHLDRIADYSLSKTYQRLFFYTGVSLGPREHWSQEYPEIQSARKTLGALSWDNP